MYQSIAGVFPSDLLHGSVKDWFSLLFIPASVVFSFAANYRRFVFQWLKGIRGSDWGAISAVIDVVSVVSQTMERRGGEQIVGYLATLTYFYRNPELQMGEYSRMFDKEEEARAWAASYKGRTVMAHVDPRDPTNSVLRKEDI